MTRAALIVVLALFGSSAAPADRFDGRRAVEDLTKSQEGPRGVVC
jgi:hypothetical protein